MKSIAVITWVVAIIIAVDLSSQNSFLCIVTLRDKNDHISEVAGSNIPPGFWRYKKLGQAPFIFCISVKTCSEATYPDTKNWAEQQIFICCISTKITPYANLILQNKETSKHKNDCGNRGVYQSKSKQVLLTTLLYSLQTHNFSPLPVEMRKTTYVN